MEIRDS